MPSPRPDRADGELTVGAGLDLASTDVLTSGHLTSGVVSIQLARNALDTADIELQVAIIFEEAFRS